ncbi:hypothetical protein HNR50_003572 [Spirochaeta isovalerica]|uniref:Uncharacterized protein n=1 Tax=Spirochaeta isovalerica TaxID=150 RepID=A0A841RET2_9SPIO|nr:hypothetical protein [Spirochaeta isovalerica]
MKTEETNLSYGRAFSLANIVYLLYNEVIQVG